MKYLVINIGIFLVHSRPLSRFYVEAWDEYHDGVFICTRYLVLSL